MKNTYPIVLTPDEVGYTVYIPDFDINTEGDSLTEAIEMARDAIGIVGVDMEDDGKKLPNPTKLNNVSAPDGSFTSLVDIDFKEYRKKNDVRAVRKNCTIPSWLNDEAVKAGLNFSALLQSAIKAELHMS